MRIALPVSNGVLCMHFGHCEQFALLDVDSKTADVKAISYLTPPPHEPGVLPVWLAEHGTQVVIAGGMGRRAIDMFTDTGIELVVGAKAADPEELAIAYLAGRIETGDNVCDH